MAKAASNRGRSALSDITPNPGPGWILTAQELDSLSRCEKAAEDLLKSLGTRFSQFDPNIVALQLHRDVLANVVRWYWYNDMEDRRTKGSDLKRELAKVVTHLASLKVAMKAVSPESRHALNGILKPPSKEQPERQDIFGAAERLNSLILEKSRPLVTSKFTKQASTSVTNACEKLALIWEKISQQPFERNTKANRTNGGTKLVTDNFEFENDGMHFVHVLLQAIDPTVTYSKVRSGMKRVTARAPRTT